MSNYRKNIYKRHGFVELYNSKFGYPTDGNISASTTSYGFETADPFLKRIQDSLYDSSTDETADAMSTMSTLVTINDKRSTCNVIKDDVAEYINTLGVISLRVGDIAKAGRHLYSFKIGQEYIFVVCNRENGVSCMQSFGESSSSKYSAYSIWRDDQVIKTSLDDLTSDKTGEHFNVSSFMLKFWQCERDGIPFVYKEAKEKQTITQGKHKSVIDKNVRYVSLSQIGRERSEDVKNAIKNIRENPNYMVANWYRRPHYRKGEVYVKGCWCTRKAGDVTNDEVITIYTK